MISPNSVANALLEYKNYPSIVKINQKMMGCEAFDFLHVTRNDIKDVILNLDDKKTIQEKSIPPKLLKQNCEICVDFFFTNINHCLSEGVFPDNLKYADIIPVFKKGDQLIKDNYRPISISPTISKVYEKIIYHQLYKYFKTIFSNYLCGFRKGFSSQHCLLYMLER